MLTYTEVYTSNTYGTVAAKYIHGNIVNKCSEQSYGVKISKLINRPLHIVHHNPEHCLRLMRQAGLGKIL